MRGYPGYTYSIGDEAPKKILNWIECDIDRDDVRSFTLLEDGRILVFMSGWDEESGMSTTELVYLTKKKGSEDPGWKYRSRRFLLTERSIWIIM